MAAELAQRIHELLDNAETAMLVTRTETGAPHARPMVLARVEVEGDVWFFTSRGSAVVHEIQSDPRVLLVCQNRQGQFASISGRAELVVDRARAQGLWHESLADWFPGGANDPNLLLIHVRAEEAEYWDRQHPNGATHAYSQAGATRAA